MNKLKSILQNYSLPSLSPQYILLGRSFAYALVVIQGYSLSILNLILLFKEESTKLRI